MEYNRQIRQVAKGGSVDVLGRIIAKAIGTVGVAVMSRLLGASAYGLYFVAHEVTRLLALVLRLGYASAILRYVGIYDGEKKRRRARAVVTGTVLTSLAATAAIAMVLAIWPQLVTERVYQKPLMTPVLRIIGLRLPAQVMFILLVFATMARGTATYRAIGNVVLHSVMLGSVVVLCGLLGFGAQGAAYASLISFTVAGGVALMGLSRLYSAIRFEDLAHYEAGVVTSFSLPLLLGELSQYGLFRVNPVIGGKWLSEADLGKYGVASQVAVGGVFGLTALEQIFSPIMADLHNRGKMEALRDMFSTTTRWAYYFTLPLMVVAVFKARSILHVFGPEFTEAVPLVQALCIGQLVNISTGPTGNALMMLGHKWLFAIDSITMAVTNIVLCVVLTRWLGVIGLALAGMTATAGVNLLRTFQLWRRYRISGYTMRAIRPVLISIPLLPLLLISLHPWWLDLLIPPSLFLAAFVAAVYLVGLDPDDRQVLEAVRRRLSRMLPGD